MYGGSFGPQITPIVKRLVIINVAVFILSFILEVVMNIPFSGLFALRPQFVLEHGAVWQIFTYQFLHGGPLHILFNMIVVWMFGSELEEKWGGSRFLKYYLTCGLGAGIIILVLPLLLGQAARPTVGASGAALGLLVAYAMYWPERYLLVFGIFPLKTKFFVIIIGGISLLFTFQGGGQGGISHVGHLGGLITGYLLLVSGAFGAQKHKGSWDIFERFRLWKKRREWNKREKQHYEFMNMEAKVDHLLEKISKHGMRSLSAEERRFLKQASENMGENNGAKGSRKKRH